MQFLVKVLQAWCVGFYLRYNCDQIIKKGNGKSQVQMISNTRYSQIYRRDFTKCKGRQYLNILNPNRDQNSIVPGNLKLLNKQQNTLLTFLMSYSTTYVYHTINMFIRVILQPADTINYSKVHRQEDAVRHNQSCSFSLALFVMQYVLNVLSFLLNFQKNQNF